VRVRKALQCLLDAIDEPAGKTIRLLSGAVDRVNRKSRNVHAEANRDEFLAREFFLNNKPEGASNAEIAQHALLHRRAVLQMHDEARAAQALLRKGAEVHLEEFGFFQPADEPM